MKLLPFHNEAAALILSWNIGSEYRRFWRGITRFLTLSECENLPQVMQSEILLIEEDKKIIGIVAIQEYDLDIFKFSILIDKSESGKGFGVSVLKQIMNYCYMVKKARYLQTECSAYDQASVNGLEHNGFVRAGVFPKYIFMNGEYEDAFIYYHRG